MAAQLTVFPLKGKPGRGRTSSFAGCNIKSNEQKTKVRDVFCLVVWFGEVRWYGGYCCDVLPGNKSHTTRMSAFPVLQDKVLEGKPHPELPACWCKCLFQTIL